jgi:sugar diacid utilization regulator
VTALLLLLGRSVAEAENKVRGELIADLLTASERDSAGLLARGRRLGVDLAADHLVLVADGGDAPRARLATAAARHATSRGGLAGLVGEQAVLVLPTRPDLVGETGRILGAALGGQVTVGAAGPVPGPVALAAAHLEAARCLRALLALGRKGQAGTLAELGFVGVLLGDRADVSGYVAKTLGLVLDYDARRGTGLADTLRAYFDCGGNLTRTKEVLHVHVNTVVQRLERVATLLGDDWQAPARALEIQLALLLHRVTEA